MTKEALTNFWLNELEKHGVPSPDSYTAEELEFYCPEIPKDFIRKHVERRDAKKNAKI